MAITRYKTFSDGQVLTAADMNGIQDQVINNEQAVGNPRTTSFDMDGQRLILSADGNTSLISSTSNKIDFRVQSADLFDIDGTTASSVNGLTFISSATGQAVRIQAKGSDTNVGVVLASKGTGAAVLRSNAVDVLTADGSTASSVNTLKVSSAATGTNPVIAVQGSDTNIGLTIATKGTGKVSMGALDINGNTFTIDGDADSSLRETSDDVLALRLQGFDAFIFDGDVASPVNGLTMTSAATTADPAIAAHGSDSNVNVRLTPKGSGVVASAGGYAVDGATNLTWRWQGSSTSLLLQENTGTPTSPTWTTRNTFLTGVGVPKGTALLATYTPSSAASVDITSVISSSFDIYDIEIALQPATDSVSLFLKTSTNNGSSWESGAIYGSQYVDHAGATVTAAAGTTSTSMEICRSNVGNAAGEGIVVTIRLHNLGSLSGFPLAVHCSWNGLILDASGVMRALQGSGFRVTGASAINAVQLLFESGNIAAGTVRVYGLPK